MSFTYKNLTQSVRDKMIDEINLDINYSSLYMSDRLTEKGKQRWSDLLKIAAKRHDDSWLTNELKKNRLLRQTEDRIDKTGKLNTVKVPSNAAKLLSQGEFNRFYMRAVCLEALERGVPRLTIYRARASSRPRAESEARINTEIEAQELLKQLRKEFSFLESDFPVGPNSGLSVYF